MTIETRISESRLVAEFLESKGVKQSLMIDDTTNKDCLNVFVTLDVTEHIFEGEGYTLILVSNKENNAFIEGIILYSSDLEIVCKAHTIQKWSGLKKQLGL